jgi:GNAT superfamily N-acetyltransferase
MGTGGGAQKKNAGLESIDRFFIEKTSTLQQELDASGFDITPFEDDDIDDVRRIFATGMQLYSDPMPDTSPLKAFWGAYIQGALDSDVKDAKSLRSVYFASGGHFWLVIDKRATDPNKRVVGHVGLEGLGGGLCELRRMSVVAGTRRGGLGKKLVRKVEEYAAEQGFKEIMLTTGSIMAPAMALYTSCGWELYRQGSPGGELAEKMTGAGESIYEAAFRKPVTSNQGCWIWKPHTEPPALKARL